MTSSLHPSLELQDLEDLIRSSSPSASLFMFTIGDEFGSGVAVGMEFWGSWLVRDCNLILRHTVFIKRVIRLVMFIWMANRLFHCLRIWKLVAKEKYKAANFPGLFAVRFWKEDRARASWGSLKVGVFPGASWGHSTRWFPKGWSLTMTGLGKSSPGKHGPFFYLNL